MGFGRQQGTKPTFFEGQEENAARAMQDIAAQILGGAPSAGAQAAANRSTQATVQSAARAGFSEKDPITQARLSAVESSRIGAEEGQRNQLLQFLLSPSGQAGGGGFNVSGLGK